MKRQLMNYDFKINYSKSNLEEDKQMCRRCLEYALNHYDSNKKIHLMNKLILISCKSMNQSTGNRFAQIFN